MNVTFYPKEQIECHTHWFRREAHGGRNLGNPGGAGGAGVSGERHDFGGGAGAEQAVGLGRPGQRQPVRDHRRLDQQGAFDD